MGSFVPVTPDEEQEMLRKIGVKEIKDLFSGIPDALKVKGSLNLPDGVSEMEAERIMRSPMPDKNRGLRKRFSAAPVRIITTFRPS
jgi:glycine cleavage system pyridoxal-binding protein P